MLSSSPGKEEEEEVESCVLPPATDSVVDMTTSGECPGRVRSESECLAEGGSTFALLSNDPAERCLLQESTKAKRRIQSAGPRLEMVKSVVDSGSDDVLPPPPVPAAAAVSPSSPPPHPPLVSARLSEGGRSEAPSSDLVRSSRRLVIVRSDVKPLNEGLNLKSSISPNLHFHCLNSLLQQNSSSSSSPESHASTPAGDPTIVEGGGAAGGSGGTTVSLSLPSPSSSISVGDRILVLDPVVGPPAKEKIFQLVEECSRQPRIVSVKREECMKKEHASIFVLKDAASSSSANQPHRSSAVTVSRSHTWNLHDRGDATGGSREGGGGLAAQRGRRLPVARNTSMADDRSSTQLKGAFSDDEVIVSTKASDSVHGEGGTGGVSQLDDDGREEPATTTTTKGRSKSNERQEGGDEDEDERWGDDVGQRRGVVLRSNSVRVGPRRKMDQPRNVCWLDVDPCNSPELGMFSRNDASLHRDNVKKKERMKDDEQMDSPTTPQSPHNDNAMMPPDDGGHRIQRCLIVHRDEKGFGFTVCGDNPVYVESVKPNGPAHKAGVQQYDRIVKVNGSLVINCNHTDVVKLIKSGSYVALTLLGRPPPSASAVQGLPPSKALDALEQGSGSGGVSTPSAASPQTPLSLQTVVVEKDKISGPHAVDHDKDLQFKAQRATTIQMMHKQVLEEYEKMKLDYQKSPTETLHYKLQVKLQMLRRVEDQLKAINASPSSASSSTLPHPQVSSPPSSSTHGEPSIVLPLKRPATLSGVATADKQDSAETAAERHAPSSLYRGPTPWLPSGPKHRKADSMPDTLYKIDEDSKDGSNTTMRMMTTRNSDDDEGGHSMDDVDMRTLPPTVVPSSSSVDSSYSSSSSSFPDHFSTSSESTTLDEASSSSSSSMPASQQPLRSELVRSKLKVISPSQVKVVVMDETDFSTVDDPGVFSDLMQLKHRPAHLAVFLHYLISNSDPAAMFFYLVTDAYTGGNIKEMKKWAYEIFSTFLCDRAPLKINVDEATVRTVSSTLQTKSDREDLMKNIFQCARIFAQNEVNDHLTDFRSKRALGLGSLYGDRDLKDNMDRQTEMRIVEAALWKHFERLTQEEDRDRSQAMASALSTFFKQIGYTSQKNNSLLERYSSFNAKDKKVFKFKTNNKKVIHTNGHQFVPQHYFASTFCFYCQNILWGIGNQGYQCTNCDINLHKNCVDVYKDSCSSGSGSLRKKKERRPPSMFDIISRKLSNTNPAAIKEAQHQHYGTDANLISTPSPLAVRPQLLEGDETDAMHRSISGNIGCVTDWDKSPDEIKSMHSTLRDQSPDNYEEEYNPNVLSVGLGRSESLNQRSGIRASVRRTHSDVSPDNQIQTPQPANSNSGSSSNSSLSARASDSSEGLNDISSTTTSTQTSVITQKSQFNDSDFDVETELPLLESVIPKELFRKLKPKEKKRQDVINELFYTERTHVRNLKVLHRIFYLPMADDPLTLILFPNLEEISDIHCALNNELKARRQESPVVGDFAEILVRRFSGEEGEKFKMAAARFCEHQSHALEVLRQRQRKDQKMATFLQEASSNSLCRRLELKDLILTELQRLTKYPLLIESLLKYTVSNTDEYDQLLKAHEFSKNLLNHVNQRVEDCENQQKLTELQKKLDRRPIENSTHPVVSEYKKLDLTRHKMIHDGVLTWRINRSKHIDHHVILFDDILVLLQKQDDRLVLRCQSGNREPGKDDSKLTHSPIVKLNNVLTRNVAVDKRAFFLVSISETIGPQIYELAASTKDERNKWFKYITDAAESYKAKDGGGGKGSKRQTTTTSISSGGGGGGSDAHHHHHHLSDVSQDDRSSSVASTSIDDHFDEEAVGGGGGGGGGMKEEKLQGAMGKADSDDHQYGGADSEAEEKRERADSMESVGRVEVLNFEPPQLVQPNEVKVSRMEVMEKLEPIKTPIDFLREKNRLIEKTMLEKKQLVARMLNIPLQDYDHIAEIAGDVFESQDVKELLFGSLAKADELTVLINEGLDESLRLQTDSPNESRHSVKVVSRRSGTDEETDDNVTTSLSSGLATCSELTHEMTQSETGRQGTSATGPTIVLPSSRLISITGQLQRHLVQIVDVILKQDLEKDSRALAAINISDHHHHQSKSLRRASQRVLPSSQLQEATSASRVVVCSSTVQQPTEELTTTDQPRCVKSSLVTFPVVMEHVEVIEVETIIPEEMTPATSTSTTSLLPILSTSSSVIQRESDISPTATASVSIVAADDESDSTSKSHSET